MQGPLADGVFVPAELVGAPRSQSSPSSRQRTPGRLAPKPPPARVCHPPAKALGRLACLAGLSRSTDVFEVPAPSPHFRGLSLGEGSSLRGHHPCLAQTLQPCKSRRCKQGPPGRPTFPTPTPEAPPRYLLRAILLGTTASTPKRKADCRMRTFP